MHDDFGRYVIDPMLDDWLRIPLNEPAWVKPKSKQELLEEFSQALSEPEQVVWSAFQEAEAALKDAQHQYLKQLITEQGNIPDYLLFILKRSAKLKKLQTQAGALAHVEKRAYEAAIRALEDGLTAEHIQQLHEINDKPEASSESRRAPKFDENGAKRYIVNRALTLGWASEFFGDFDRHTTGYRGREASKAERIGKKYQWIALHEIMAYIADHYQFHDRYSWEDAATLYEGPWQPGARDLDPSNVLHATSSSTTWPLNERAWWAPQQQQHWGKPEESKEWLQQWSDLPIVESLLLVAQPNSESKWLNASGHFGWSEPTSPDQDEYEVDRKRIWYIVTGYLVRASDVSAFMHWAEADRLEKGRDMPEPTRLYEVFLGEHSWSPASHFYQGEYNNGEVWQQPRECPVEIQVIGHDYLNERGTFDCSLDETISLNLPRAELIEPLGLRWTGIGGDFVDAAGALAAFDPTAQASGPGALLLREDLVNEFLIRENLALCWIVIGEKQVLSSGINERYYGRMSMSGAYTLTGQGIKGFLNCFVEKSTRDEDSEDVLIHSIKNV